MTQNKSLKGFLIWGICASFFLYEFFLRTIFGSYQHPIMNDLDLSLVEFSLVSSTVFLMIYGIMQIPVGIIIDHLGLKKSLFIASIICALSTFLTSYSDNFHMAVVSRILMGAGASFGFICLLVSVDQWLPRDHRALFIGLSQFIGTLGPIIAAGPMESLKDSDYGSWRNVFFILGIIGVIIALLALLLVENRKKQKNITMVLSRPQSPSSSMSRLFMNLQPWAIAIVSACLYFSLEYLSENEGRYFLSQKQIEPSLASYMLTIGWIGYGIGAPFLGFISDYIKRRRIILILGAISSLISTVIIVYGMNEKLLIFGFFLLGISTSAQSIGFAIMAEQFKDKFVALGFGLNNAIIMFMAAINVPIIGFFLDLNKSGSYIMLEEYICVFNILIAISVIGVIISIFFIKETYCKSQADFTYLNSN